MNEPSVNLDDALALAALADGIIPADERDAGAASVHAGPIIAERIGRTLSRAFIGKRLLPRLRSSSRADNTIAAEFCKKPLRSLKNMARNLRNSSRSKTASRSGRRSARSRRPRATAAARPRLRARRA